MPDRDYYDILGVAKNATADEIKRAYRKLARKYHPDVNPGSKDAERKFKEVQEAYDVLGDAENRRKYDQFGRAGFAGAGAGGGPRVWRYAWSSQGGEPPFRGFDPSSFDFSSVFGESFGFGGPFAEAARRSDRAAGRDVEHEVQIPFVVAARGGEVQIEVERDRPCARCHGSRAEPGSRLVRCVACDGSGRRSFGGPIALGVPCEACAGQGRTPERACSQCGGAGVAPARERITVKIPAGVDDGSRVRLKGQGVAGATGQPGDLYIITRVAPHPYFRRDGSDIILEVPLSVAEGALGAKVDVPTIDGTVTVNVPAGTSSGQRLRIRGRGIAKPGGRGDQYVEVKIVLPPKLDEESRDLIRRFGERNPHNPRSSLGW